jgi:hypothetical protein
LSHEINHGYKLAMLPVETFNSTPVQNLAHLAHLVDTSDDSSYINIGLDGGRFITLDRQQVSQLAVTQTLTHISHQIDKDWLVVGFSMRASWQVTSGEHVHHTNSAHHCMCKVVATLPRWSRSRLERTVRTGCKDLVQALQGICPYNHTADLTLFLCLAAYWIWQVLEHTPHILKINNIPSDRSEDLVGPSAEAAAQAGAEEAAAAAAAGAASPPASQAGNAAAGPSGTDMEH